MSLLGCQVAATAAGDDGWWWCSLSLPCLLREWVVISQCKCQHLKWVVVVTPQVQLHKKSDDVTRRFVLVDA